jgi:hypothetical protein
VRASISWEPAPWGTAPHHCFADEIAIDFPSVGDVVDRMRDAFLGEDGDVELLSTDLALSPDDAARGLTVPFDVPMRATCGVCGGRGEIWNEMCDACVGTGDALAYHTVHLTVPSGVVDGTRFRFRLTSAHAAVVRVEVRVAIRSSSSI